MSIPVKSKWLFALRLVISFFHLIKPRSVTEAEALSRFVKLYSTPASSPRPIFPGFRIYLTVSLVSSNLESSNVKSSIKPSSTQSEA